MRYILGLFGLMTFKRHEELVEYHVLVAKTAMEFENVTSGRHRPPMSQ